MNVASVGESPKILPVGGDFGELAIPRRAVN